MSNEFRGMNSLDDLIHVRIDHWKLFAGHVLVDATRLTMKSERGGRQVARIQSARVLYLPTYWPPIVKFSISIRRVPEKPPRPCTTNFENLTPLGSSVFWLVVY